MALTKGTPFVYMDASLIPDPDKSQIDAVIGSLDGRISFGAQSQTANCNTCSS